VSLAPLSSTILPTREMFPMLVIIFILYGYVALLDRSHNQRVNGRKKAAYLLKSVNTPELVSHYFYIVSY